MHTLFICIIQWGKEIIKMTSCCFLTSKMMFLVLCRSNSIFIRTAESYLGSGGPAVWEGREAEVHPERNGLNEEGARCQTAKPAENAGWA